MTEAQMIITVLVLALSVWITRFLPFFVFTKTERLPKAVDYLGRVLPAAMMGLLVVYCFKDYTFTDWHTIVPVLISVTVVAALHLIKRNTILSISVGTAVYMILIRVM